MDFFAKGWFGFYRVKITDESLVWEVGFSFLNKRKVIGLSKIKLVNLLSHDVAPHLILSFDTYYLLIQDIANESIVIDWMGFKKASRVEILKKLKNTAPQAIFNSEADQIIEKSNTI